MRTERVPSKGVSVVMETGSSVVMSLTKGVVGPGISRSKSSQYVAPLHAKAVLASPLVVPLLLEELLLEELLLVAPASVARVSSLAVPNAPQATLTAAMPAMKTPILTLRGYCRSRR